MKRNSFNQDTNSNKQYDYIPEYDTESDVEEIGQEDYYSNHKESKSPKIPNKTHLSPSKNQFISTNTTNLPTWNIQYDFISPVQPNFNTQSERIPSYTNLPTRSNPPPPPPMQTNFKYPSRPNLTSQGQSPNPNLTTFSLHPSIQVPNYYTFTYHGLTVKFPYEKPYEAQKMLISNSILAFKSGQNALLESPTGTGKSLALLSAALSYLETAPQIVKLYYTSRTHIQLQQLVSELKKLPYFPQFSILASKRHLCIVPQVANSNSPEYECRKLCEEDGCPYANSENNGTTDIEDVKVRKPSTPNSSVPFEFTNRGTKPKFDLNDLKEYGQKHMLCPYQLAFNIYHTAQLVFCPYNYILKPNDDKNLLLDFPKDTTIAIFDEGHNIESTAREDASLTMSYRQVFEARRTLQYVPPDDNFKTMFEQVQKVQTDILNFIQNKRIEYNKNYDSYPINNRPKYLSADSIRSVFVTTDEKLVSSVGVQMFNWLKLLANSDKESQERDKMYVNDIIISFFSQTADVLLALTPSTFDFYRIVFVPDEKSDMNQDEFRLLCLKPSFLFDKINRKTRSIIISSGTLSPLESFAAELESSFPIRVSAPHVVDQSQVVTISINSFKNCRITSRYSTIQAHGDEIYSALSYIISRTLKTVPGGSLFFTPSYYSKDMIIREWKSNGMYDEIMSIKPIVEEKANLSARQIINEFTSFKDGALLIGVCRGKISEGLDFADDLSRIVYVFGIPYPGFKEADVELKMKYNDLRHSCNKSYLSGQEWYTCQAFRALFQSVGRCLRHTNDYGAIVFLDERIDSNTEKLPTWLKSNIYKNQSVDQAERILSTFYKCMKEKYPTSGSSSSLNSNLMKSSFDMKNSPSDSFFSNQKYQSPKPFKMNSFSPSKSSSSFISSRNLYENSFSPSQNPPYKDNSESKFSPLISSYTNNTENKNSSSNSFNQIKPDQKFSPSISPYTNNTENKYSSSNSFNQIKPEQKFSPSISPYTNNTENKNSSSNSFNQIKQDQKFSPSISPYTNNTENKYSSSNSFNQIKPEQKFSPSISPYTNNTESKNSSSNSFNQIKPEQKFSPYQNISEEKKSFNMKREPESNFSSSSGYYDKIKDEKIDQEAIYVDNEYELDKEIREKDERNKFLTDMFCNSCGSLIIKIKNLDSADFKTIYLSEFFQIMNSTESKTKIMYLMKSAVQTDLTKVGKTIISEDFSVTLSRRDCPKCGKPIGVYVSDSNENSEFKKGELLLRQDMLAMEFDGEILSLVEIALNA